MMYLRRILFFQFNSRAELNKKEELKNNIIVNNNCQVL